MALPWSEAWRRASTGDRGFWRREVPSSHFATSTGPVLAQAMVRLLQDVSARITGGQGAGEDGGLDVIDVGAGDGTLLNAMADILEGTELGARCRLRGLDVRPRPPALRDDVEWWEGDALELPAASVRGLVMAHEWLDEVPLDIIQRDARGTDRLVLVGEDGLEALGDPVPPDDPLATWAADWWPLREIGDRAEIGCTRDLAWDRLCASVRIGAVVASDYPRCGPDATLRGYHGGKVVHPVPDGSCNLTADVTLGSCVAATAGRRVSTWTQREALASLGVSGELPDPTTMDGGDFARELSRAFSARALRAVGGRGSFRWLRADVG